MGTLGFLFSPEKKSKSNSSNNCTALYQGNTASSRQKKIEAAGRHTQGQFRKKKKKKRKIPTLSFWTKNRRRSRERPISFSFWRLMDEGVYWRFFFHVIYHQPLGSSLLYLRKTSSPPLFSFPTQKNVEILFKKLYFRLFKLSNRTESSRFVLSKGNEFRLLFVSHKII